MNAKMVPILCRFGSQDCFLLNVEVNIILIMKPPQTGCRLAIIMLYCCPLRTFMQTKLSAATTMVNDVFENQKGNETVET